MYILNLVHVVHCYHMHYVVALHTVDVTAAPCAFLYEFSVCKVSKAKFRWGREERYRH